MVSKSLRGPVLFAWLSLQWQSMETHGSLLTVRFSAHYSPCKRENQANVFATGENSHGRRRRWMRIKSSENRFIVFGYGYGEKGNEFVGGGHRRHVLRNCVSNSEVELISFRFSPASRLSFGNSSRHSSARKYEARVQSSDGETKREMCTMRFLSNLFKCSKINTTSTKLKL